MDKIYKKVLDIRILCAIIYILYLFGMKTRNGGKVQMDRRKEWKFETKQLHVGQEEADLATGARAVPIYI